MQIFIAVLLFQQSQHVFRQIDSGHFQSRKPAENGIQFQTGTTADIQYGICVFGKQFGHPAVMLCPLSHMGFIISNADVEKSIHGFQRHIFGFFQPLFERKIFVYTQEGNNPAATLKLSVDVSNGSDSSTMWPIQMGGIRLRNTEVTFTLGRKAVENISFINLTGKTLKLECEEMFLPDCLTFSSSPVEHGA